MNLGSYCNEKLRINTPKILVNSINPKKDHKNEALPPEDLPRVYLRI